MGFLGFFFSFFLPVWVKLPPVPLLKTIVWEPEIFKKVDINKNVRTTHHASWIQVPDYSKSAINWKNDNDIIICWHDIIVNFFWRCCVSLVKFSYWSKFHVNIITWSGVMTIFVYKGFTRKSKIGNPPVWAFSNIWRLGQVKDTKFGYYIMPGFQLLPFLKYYGKTRG